jgi:hypothetical protein
MNSYVFGIGHFIAIIFFLSQLCSLLLMLFPNATAMSNNLAKQIDKMLQFFSPAGQGRQLPPFEAHPKPPERRILSVCGPRRGTIHITKGATTVDSALHTCCSETWHVITALNKSQYAFLPTHWIRPDHPLQYRHPQHIRRITKASKLFVHKGDSAD